MSQCSILFLGDIVGRPGRSFVQQQLPFLKEKYHPDFIFANVENATGGFGITAATANELYSMGIQGMTLGNHVWDQRSLWNEIHALPFLCRPTNFPAECPGARYITFDFDGKKFALFCLMGRAFSNNTALDCPFKSSQSLIEELKSQGVDNFIVDVHAEATAEKYTLGWFLSDLGVTCVLGTHTHIQTADERVLNEKTAFICDLGMCGAYNGILGFQKEPIIAKSVYGKPCRFEVAKGPTIITGILACIDLEKQKALSIQRIQCFSDN